MADDGRGPGGGGGKVVPFVPSRGAPPAPDSLSLAELWRRYWLGPGALLTNPNSRKNYLRCQQLSEHLPDFPVPETIEQWTARLLDLGYNPRTADMHRYILGGLFAWSRDAGLVSTNPVALSRRVRPPPAESHPIRNIGTTFPLLLTICRDQRERALLAVLRYTGCRPEEAFALQAGDVMEQGKRLGITRQRPRLNEWTTKAPKGERQRGFRSVPIRPGLLELLRPVLVEPPVQLRFRVAGVGYERRESPFLFPYRANDERDLRGRLGAIAPEHFGHGNGLHTFRHTLAFELYQAGTEVTVISEVLGHESVLTTENYLSRMAGGRVRSDCFAKLQVMEEKKGPAGDSAGEPRSDPLRGEPDQSKGGAPESE